MWLHSERVFLRLSMVLNVATMWSGVSPVVWIKLVRIRFRLELSKGGFLVSSKQGVVQSPISRDQPLSLGRSVSLSFVVWGVIVAVSTSLVTTMVAIYIHICYIYIYVNPCVR